MLYEQLGLSNLLRAILGPENKILSGRNDLLQIAMKIDELEEVLDQEDIHALYWVNDHIEVKDLAGFLLDLEDEYIKASEQYCDTGTIEGIEKHFMDGMQYVYCYLKDLPMNNTTQADAVKWFLSNKTNYKLRRVIVAYAIGYLIEAMLEE